MDDIQVQDEAYHMQHDEVDLHTITIDPDPYEIHVDNAAVTFHTEVYMILQLPVDGQHAGSVCVKVDTRPSGNIMPLYVFQHLYPNQVTPDSTPSGIYQS